MQYRLYSSGAPLTGTDTPQLRSHRLVMNPHLASGQHWSKQSMSPRFGTGLAWDVHKITSRWANSVSSDMDEPV